MTLSKKMGFTAIILFIQLSAFGQNLEVIKFDDLDKMLKTQTPNNTVYNFWATWCGPCIKELPQFEALGEKYKNEGLEVILISLDFEDSKNKVQNFITKKKLKSKVYLLDETDYNTFINKVDPNWSGAIPATIFINGRSKKRTFYEQEFKEGELDKIYSEIKS